MTKTPGHNVGFVWVIFVSCVAWINGSSSCCEVPLKFCTDESLCYLKTQHVSRRMKYLHLLAVRLTSWKSFSRVLWQAKPATKERPLQLEMTTESKAKLHSLVQKRNTVSTHSPENQHRCWMIHATQSFAITVCKRLSTQAAVWSISFHRRGATTNRRKIDHATFHTEDCEPRRRPPLGPCNARLSQNVFACGWMWSLGSPSCHGSATSVAECVHSSDSPGNP